MGATTPLRFLSSNKGEQVDGIPHPHQIVIDLGKMTEFKSLRYVPRNGANPGKIKDYKSYASKDLFNGLLQGE